MSSSINPNNIDTAYPVAGQDNDSQGFRDNFTNIKTNFSYAQEELEDIQAKGIFKSALSGSTLNNDMAGAPIKSALMQDVRESWGNLGLANTSPINLNIAEHSFFTMQTAGDVTLNFTNVPASGDYAKFRLMIDVANTDHEVTLPVEVTIGANLVTGLSSSVITYTDTGKYLYEFSTYDGGSSYIVLQLITPTGA
jgi:hypothetical protein